MLLFCGYCERVLAIPCAALLSHANAKLLVYFPSLLPRFTPSTSTYQSLSPPHLTYQTSSSYTISRSSLRPPPATLSSGTSPYNNLFITTTLSYLFAKLLSTMVSDLATVNWHSKAKVCLGTKSQLQSPKARSRRRVPAAVAHMLDDQRPGEGSYVCSFNQRHASQRSVMRIFSHLFAFLTASRLPPNLVRREHDPC